MRHGLPKGMVSKFRVHYTSRGNHLSAVIPASAPNTAREHVRYIVHRAEGQYPRITKVKLIK